jgi:hypothetical protein
MTCEKQLERVWIVGAGFSAGLGYPVGAQLVPCLIQYLSRQPITTASNCPAVENTLSECRESVRQADEILAKMDRVLKEYFASCLDHAGEVTRLAQS